MAKLVFVCHGNICRSPMAERVARRMVDEAGFDVEVESFALSSEEIGNPIDPRAVTVLEKAGYEATGHAARRIAREEIEEAHLVVAAEPHQVEHLLRIAPGADNVVLLNDFNPALPVGTPLQDPWYGDDAGFNDTLADIEAAMPAILDEVVSR